MRTLRVKGSSVCVCDVYIYLYYKNSKKATVNNSTWDNIHARLSSQVGPNRTTLTHWVSEIREILHKIRRIMCKIKL